MTPTMSERIQRGIALLDERVPDWRTRVSARRLNTNSPWDCILGQLFGTYSTGLSNLGLGSVYPYTIGKAYGFDIENGEEYADLTAAWREVLA